MLINNTTDTFRYSRVTDVTRTVVPCGELELGAVAAVACRSASSDVEHIDRGRLEARDDRAGDFSASGRVAQLFLLLL